MLLHRQGYKIQKVVLFDNTLGWWQFKLLFMHEAKDQSINGNNYRAQCESTRAISC